MKKRAAIKVRLAAFFLGAGILLSFTPLTYGLEHPRYDIKATIDTAGKSLSAEETVTFTNNSQAPVDALYFHIYPNRKYSEKEKNFMLLYAGYFKINPFPEGFKESRLVIRSVASEEAKLSFTVEGDDETILKVQLKRSLNPGETTRVTLDFSLAIPHMYGRFGWHENIIALARWYPILSVLDGKGWNNNPFYPFHRPFYSDAADYAVTLDIPSGYVVINTGEKKQETPAAGKRAVYEIETRAPVRDFAMAICPDYKVLEASVDGIKIKSFYFPGTEDYAKQALQTAVQVFQYYTERFGAYPYREFSIAPVHLGYGGEQMSNMVFIDTRAYQLPKFLIRYFDFLVSHEVGHQWFYNIVGVDGFREMWLEEGVNSYFNLYFLENKYGKNAEIAEWPKALEWLLPNFSFRRGRDYRYKLIARTTADQPVTGKLSDFTEPASIFSITYGKGSMIVSMLKYLLGDEAFQKVFRKVFEEYRFKNLTTEDFIALCEKESGQNLRWFFEEWLYTSEKFDASVKVVNGNRVVFENRGGITMPVKAEVEFSDGKKAEVAWNGKNKTEEKMIGNSPIKRVTLDETGELLDIDRTNNTWPRKVNFKAVPLYLGLYDMPIFASEDGYNLIYGPEVANGGVGIKASLQKPFDQNFYAASDIDFNDDLLKSRLGYQLNNVGHSFRTFGFELFNTEDLDGGEEDLAGGKAYLRQELWPASYGLTELNDHVTFYFIRDRSLNRGFDLSGNEDSRNTSYLKKDEAIIGTALHLGKAGPYPDPLKGYKVDTLFESSGHMLGATQYFYRGSLDTAFYQPVTPKTKLALRLKYGWGYPSDKNLYELGGLEGLRGYDRKEWRGASMVLGSLEYRFPLKEGLKLSFFDNIIGVESLGAVIFADAGQSWFGDIDDSQLKKDAGLGLRATVTVGSFLEKVLLRFDIAEPIHDSNEDTHFWFGAGHAF